MIVLSAGHHEQRKGACNGDICEWDIATKWVETIKSYIDPFFDSEIIDSGTLREKVVQVNALAPKFAVELHFNSNINASGSECLYYPGSEAGKELSETVLNQLENIDLFQPNRGAKEGWYRMDAPGREDYLGDVEGDETIDYFLRKTKCTSVIIEPQFMYHIDDILNNHVYACRAIADGLIKFYHKYYGF